MGKLLDINEVADQLGVAPQTIYRWRTEGRDMPNGIKVVGRLRWRQETVDAWIDRELAKVAA